MKISFLVKFAVFNLVFKLFCSEFDLTNVIHMSYQLQMTVERRLFPARLHEHVSVVAIVDRFDDTDLQEDDCQVRLLLRETRRRLVYFQFNQADRPILV